MRALPQKYATKPLAEAGREKGVSPDDRRKIDALVQRIPEGMRGVFSIVFVPDEQRKPKLYGLMLSPDPALEIMYDKLGKRLQPTKHGDHLSYVLAGKGLDLVLSDDTAMVRPPCRGSQSGAIAKKALCEYYAHHAGEPYIDTFPLRHVAEEAGLSTAEKEAVKTILGHIPPNLRDLYYANVTSRDGHPTIESIGVDPQLTLHLINESFLSEVARDPEARCPVGPARNRGEVPQEITHSHSRSMVRNELPSAESIAIKLARRLGPPPQFRSYDN
jgi:hypothetical protein